MSEALSALSANSAPILALNSQATATAALRRERAQKPTPAKPATIITQVDASGTLV